MSDVTRGKAHDKIFRHEPPSRRRMRLIDVSEGHSFTPERLADLLRATSAANQMQSLERAASVAGDLESLLRSQLAAYHEQVLLPLEAQNESSLPRYLRSSTLEEPITFDLSYGEGEPTHPFALSDPPGGSAKQGPRGGRHILQRGIQVSLGVMFASIFVMLASNAAGLAGLFVGLSIFCFSNYAAYRSGDRDVIILPRVALMGAYGGLGLAATMIVAAFA